jgi:hypothetical protein
MYRLCGLWRHPYRKVKLSIEWQAKLKSTSFRLELGGG